MKNFYRGQLTPTVRLGDGGMAPTRFVLTLVDVAWATCAAAVVRSVAR